MEREAGARVAWGAWGRGRALWRFAEEEGRGGWCGHRPVAVGALLVCPPRPG